VDTYRANVCDPNTFIWFGDLLREVRFHNSTTPDGRAVPPPDPGLLAIHAACAQVAHLSGAGEVLYEFDRDNEGLCDLANNSPWDMSSTRPVLCYLSAR
jgi:hypothetical protein